MKITSFDQLETSLKKGNISGVYIIRGDNAYHTKKAFEIIKKVSLNGNENEFTYCSFDGKNCEVDEVSLSCEMFPLMGEHKCVCITDMAFEKLTAEDFESLCNLIQDVPDFTTLVFYALSNELDTKKEKTKTIVNLISKNGCELDFTVKEAKKQSLQFINALAKEKGIKISSANARVISEKACGDFSVIETELEKLSNYKNGGEITLEDIEKVFSLYLDTTVFELSRYVLSNNLEASLKILAEIKQQKEEPIAVLAGLSSNFIDLYRANAAKNKGITLETATEDFQYKSSVSFRIQNAFRDCSRYSDKFIKTCIEKMSQTDILLKTTGTDGYTLLEQLIIDIFVARERVGN